MGCAASTRQPCTEQQPVLLVALSRGSLTGQQKQPDGNRMRRLVETACSELRPGKVVARRPIGAHVRTRHIGLARAASWRQHGGACCVCVAAGNRRARRDEVRPATIAHPGHTSITRVASIQHGLIE